MTIRFGVLELWIASGPKDTSFSPELDIAHVPQNGCRQEIEKVTGVRFANPLIFRAPVLVLNFSVFPIDIKQCLPVRIVPISIGLMPPAGASLLHTLN